MASLVFGTRQWRSVWTLEEPEPGSKHAVWQCLSSNPEGELLVAPSSSTPISPLFVFASSPACPLPACLPHSPTCRIEPNLRLEGRGHSLPGRVQLALPRNALPDAASETLHALATRKRETRDGKPGKQHRHHCRSINPARALCAGAGTIGFGTGTTTTSTNKQPNTLMHAPHPPHRLFGWLARHLDTVVRR